MEQYTYDHEGLQYVFGYLDKNRGWRFVPHRFQIVNEPNQTVVGQFITSLWFSHIYNPNTVQQYMILGIRGQYSYSALNQLADEDDSNGKNRSPCRERLAIGRGGNVVFKDYFEISAAETKALADDCTLDETKVANTKGIINNSTLSLRMRKYNGGLYVTLPSFIRSRLV